MQGNSGNSITTKDLSVLQDQLDAEYRANRKAAIYAQTMTDPQLKGLANTLAQHHKARFDAMFSYLNGQ